MDAPVNAPRPDEPDSSSAVLVVTNGRQAGARRPLTEPLTLIGRAPVCDIRLNVKAVQPHHAMLVEGPDGFLLRNLAGQGVSVNGAAATVCRIDHGDVIAVGPFQFRLEQTGPSAKQAAEAERDALRVQAAAVAAQQAALLEEEVRLRAARALPCKSRKNNWPDIWRRAAAACARSTNRCAGNARSSSSPAPRRPRNRPPCGRKRRRNATRRRRWANRSRGDGPG